MLRYLVHHTPLRIYLTYPFQWFLAHVYFRIYCPGNGDMTVKQCIRSGECGCDNQR